MEALTVTQLNQHIKLLLEHDEVLRDILVRGETSNNKIYPSGHHYFTIKDAEASLKCVMFKGSADKLTFRPADGMKVVAAGRVSVYPRDGVYQLYCSHLTADGEGALMQAFDELKRRLEDEGLFDPSHKKPLPRYPERVALVTSPAGAAVRDMIRIFRRRWPLCKLIIAPVRVQGEEAPGEIAQVIRYISRHNLADVIITGRGGGSLEDLWAFNDERVARAIFASTIPVVSAVGHEPDVLISDFVADVRASTPSHAAELVAPDGAELLAWTAQAQARLPLLIRKRLENITLSLGNRVKALRSPEMLLQDKRLRLDYASERLRTLAAQAVRNRRQELAGRVGRLEAMSPLRVLARGFSVAQDDNGAIITNAQRLQPGDLITLRPAKGQAICRVERVIDE